MAVKKSKTKTQKKIEKEITTPDSIECEIEVGVMKELVNTILTLTDEVILKFSKKDGLSVMAIDDQHILLGIVTIEKGAFHKYKINKEGIQIGIDLDNVKNFLMKEDKDTMVSISYHPDTMKLHMMIGNLTRKFEVIDSSSLIDNKVPVLEWAHFMELPGTILQLSVKAIEQLLTDVIEFQCDGKTIIIKGEDDTNPLDNVEVPISEKKINLDKYDRKKMEISHYPIDYVNKIFKLLRNKEVTIYLKKEYPMKLEWTNMETREHEMRSVFLIAPRIMEDGE